MKVLISIILSFFCFYQATLGQESLGYLENPKLQEIIRLCLDGEYDKTTTLLKFYGFRKSLYPYHNTQGTYDPVFTYRYDVDCDGSDLIVTFSAEETSKGNFEYYFRHIYYSSILHEKEEEQMIEFLERHAYNPGISIGTGGSVPSKYLNTMTPESVKRNGNIYLYKASFFALDASVSHEPSSYCDLRYRIGCDMYFRRGYAVNDTIGYVSTWEGSNLRMRSGPSLDSTIIMSIPDKSKVSIIEYADKVEIIDRQSGNWVKVKYADKTGWVWGNYILRESEKRTP